MAGVAIIGAWVAGLGAASRLHQSGVAAEVFEAAPRLGGRAITETHGAARFDTGAQFFRTETSLAEETVLRELPSDGLLDIRADVRPFARGGHIGEGDALQNAMPKWVYRRGIRELARLLWAAGRPTVHLGWRVERIAWNAAAWSVIGTKGAAGPFDAVLVTATPRAAGRILEMSTLPSAEGVCEELARVSYRSIIAVVLGFEHDGSDPPAYALVNTDRGHDISWIAFEEEKAGYVPAGHRVLVAHMATGWSGPRMNLRDRQIVAEAEPAVRRLAGLGAAPVRWSSVTRWPEALPDALLNRSVFAPIESRGLFFAGDAFTGGRVHLAMEDGLATGERMAAYLSGGR